MGRAVLSPGFASHHREFSNFDQRLCFGNRARPQPHRITLASPRESQNAQGNF
jgi:hypothetical protein